jgi:hypothetical protein
VDRSIQMIREMTVIGYRLGLIFAAGLSGNDFELLDEAEAWVWVHELVRYGRDDIYGGTFSVDFSDYIRGVLSTLTDDRFAPELGEELRGILGDAHHPEVGVRWEGETGSIRPDVSCFILSAVVLALRNVRDEALRRITTPASSGGEQP